MHWVICLTGFLTTEPRNRSKPWPADTKISLLFSEPVLQCKAKQNTPSMIDGYRIHNIFLFIALRLASFLLIFCLTQFPRIVFTCLYNMDLQFPVARWGSTTLISNFLETMTAEIAHQRKSPNHVTKSCRIDQVCLGKHKGLWGKPRGLFLVRMCTTCWDSTPNKRT